MKARGDFLLEIGCEEIPAAAIPKAANELKVLLEKYFSTAGLSTQRGIETFGAPRRLVAIASSIPLKQADATREVLGPPKAIAFDNVGQPTRAAESFAEKQGVPLSQLVVVQTPKGEYVAARQIIRGRAAQEILAEILPQAILGISFARSMYWTGADGPRFARPIRWIVALLDGQVVHFDLAGVPAGNWTAGHRFLGKAKIPVRDSNDYVDMLR